jgi:endonuclease/exonuclease/phosphatase family metal-dependent hydrolase
MKRLLYRSLLLFNLLAVAALLLSFLSVHINPGVTVLPAFFGLAFPYLLLLNIMFMLLWAVRLRPEALISLAIILMGSTHLSNYIKIRKPGKDKSATIKVISYNVHLFNNLATKKPGSSEKPIIDFLKEQQPDIICLQELYFSGSPSGKESEIRAEFGGLYKAHMKVLEAGRNRYTGIITLSRLPVISKGEIIHPGSASLSVYTDVLSGDDTIRIYNNHLQSFRLMSMEKPLLEEITASDNQETINNILNISGSLKQGFVKRAAPAGVLKRHIDSSPWPGIVAGDFNDTPVSYSYRKIRKGLKDAFVTSGYGAGFTYKDKYPPNRIDYILYSDFFESKSFEIRKLRYSDHYPVVAWLGRAD